MQALKQTKLSVRSSLLERVLAHGFVRARKLFPSTTFQAPATCHTPKAELAALCRCVGTSHRIATKLLDRGFFGIY